MLLSDVCPACGASRYKKNGPTRHGQQLQPCQACQRYREATDEDRLIADARRPLMEPLLRERIALCVICRAVCVSLTWLLPCIGQCVVACLDDVYVQLPKRLMDVALRWLEAEADEIGGFVQRKANT